MSRFTKYNLTPAILLLLLVVAVLWRASKDEGRETILAALEFTGVPLIPDRISANSILRVELEKAYERAAGTASIPLEIPFLYHANGYYEQAIASYPIAINPSQDGERARYLHALAALESGYQDLAISELESLASSDTDYSVAYLRLGDVLLKQQNLENAASAYHASIEKGGSLIHAQLGLAQLSIQSEQWETAEDWLLEAIRSDNSISTPYTLLGLVYGKLGQSDKQQEALRMSYLKSEYPEPPDPWKEHLLLNYSYDPYLLMISAEMAGEADRPDLADQLLERVTVVASGNAKALVALGTARMESELSKAREHFQAAISLDPDAENGYLGLAETFARDEDLKGAMAVIENGLQTVSTSANLYNYLGELYLSQKLPRKALQAFQKAHQLNPMGLIPMRNLGSLLLAEGDSRGSRLLERYLAFQPDDQQVARSYAQWLVERQGEFSKGIAILQKTIDSVSVPAPITLQTLASAFSRQATDHLLQRQLQKAAEALQNSLEAWPDNPEAHANLGMIHAQLGEHEAAEAALSEFARKQPNNPVGWLNLGKARVLAERPSEAIRAWEKGLKVARETNNQSAEAEFRQLISRFSN